MLLPCHASTMRKVLNLVWTAPYNMIAIHPEAELKAYGN